MKIAVIGGIGSGKSLMIKCLKELGQRTCDCDEIYQSIAESDEYIRQVGELFDVVKDGVIDRVSLAKTVFSDSEKLKRLNALAHPLVFEEIDRIYAEDGESNLYIEVSAFQLDMAQYFDEIIYVKSNLQSRIERVKARNGFSDEHILSIINSQLSEEQMQDIADYIIINDGKIEEIEEQTEHIVAFHSFD